MIKSPKTERARGAQPIRFNKPIHQNEERSTMSDNDTNDTRWSARRRVQLRVEIYCAGRPYARCVTRDIGFGGMFIEARRAALPRCGRNLELVVSEEQPAGGGYSHRFHAKVVRQSARGLGVAFSRYDMTDVRALQAFL